MVQVTPRPSAPAPPPPTLAAVSVFRQTCRAQASKAALLAWAAARQPQLPPAGMIPPGMNRPGQGCVVDSELVFVRLDTGECQVIAHFGVLERCETALPQLPDTEPGFSIGARKDRMDPQHGLVQRLYDWEGTSWSQDVRRYRGPTRPRRPAAR